MISNSNFCRSVHWEQVVRLLPIQHHGQLVHHQGFHYHLDYHQSPSLFEYDNAEAVIIKKVRVLIIVSVTCSRRIAESGGRPGFSNPGRAGLVQTMIRAKVRLIVRLLLFTDASARVETLRYPGLQRCGDGSQVLRKSFPADRQLSGCASLPGL